MVLRKSNEVLIIDSRSAIISIGLQSKKPTIEGNIEWKMILYIKQLCFPFKIAKMQQKKQTGPKKKWRKLNIQVVDNGIYSKLSVSNHGLHEHLAHLFFFCLSLKLNARTKTRNKFIHTATTKRERKPKIKSNRISYCIEKWRMRMYHGLVNQRWPNAVAALISMLCAYCAYSNLLVLFVTDGIWPIG